MTTSIERGTERMLEVAIRSLVPQPYVGMQLRKIPVAEVGPSVRQGYRDLFAKLAAAGATPLGPPFLVASHPEGGTMDVEIGVPCVAPTEVEGVVAGTLRGGTVAVATYRGRYEEIGPTYEALSKWIFANGHTMAGPPREVYLTGPDDVASPDEHVTEVVWPLG